MADQNFSNHTRLVPLFHYVAYPAVTFALVVSGFNLYKSINDGSGRLNAAAIFALTAGVMSIMWFSRYFPLKAHDKAIRAEENLRHFTITGQLLDSKLTMPQIVALRFAPNNELVELAQRAVAENLSSKQIKASIKNWKEDNNRV